MPDQPTNTRLLSSLGRLVRGLSALFWGLPVALVVCVQSAKTEWLNHFGAVPPLVVTGWLLYGLCQLEHFQPQERVWRQALDRAKLLALLNLGLSPFVYFWNRLPGNAHFALSVALLVLGALLFLSNVNQVLRRLSAMLPDEALRLETRHFVPLNRFLLHGTALGILGYFLLLQLKDLPAVVVHALYFLERVGLWPLIFVILLPLAMTMALLWKTKEVILTSVFGPEA